MKDQEESIPSRFTSSVTNNRSSSESQNQSSSSTSTTTLFKEWLAAGTANALTSGFLNPMDVAKTRLQSYAPGHPAHGSLIRTLVVLYQEGGVVGLWAPGLQASAIREMLNSGARAGFYTSVKQEIYKLWNTQNTLRSGESETNNNNDRSNNDLTPKILAAMVTGVIGASIANPIDVIKIRLMNNPTLYPSTLSAFPAIVRTEGIGGLYKGLAPSVLRGSFISAGELATYDHSKTMLKSYGGLAEGSALHVCSSLITGLVATTVAAPFDTLKTR